MLLLIAALGVARSAYLSSISQVVLPRDAASTIFDTTVTFLRHGVRIIVAAAIVVALIAFLFGQPLRRLSGAVLERWGQGPWVGWTARHERALMLAVAAVGGLVLLFSSPLTAKTVLWVLLIGGVLAAVIAAIASQAGDAVADQLDADQEYQHGHDHGVVGG